jgi:flagella basal body P-ring formation protein FlgA
MSSWWLTLLGTATLAAAPCVVVDGPRILGRHLAAAEPAFAAIAPDQAFGFTPAPGARRTVEPGELRRWARQGGLELEIQQSLCFVARTEQLTEEKITAALRTALALPEDASIRITSHSNWPVPVGTLEFPAIPATQLRPDRPDGTRLFRGVIRYGDRLTHPVWARAAIGVRQPYLVAAEALRADQPISPQQLELREHEGFPLPAGVATSTAEVSGRAPRQTIAAGQPLRLSQLTEPVVVNAGELVEVEVRSGQARIRFSGHARTAGRAGQRILIENPATHRRVSARVVAPGRAVVAVSAISRRLPAPRSTEP